MKSLLTIWTHEPFIFVKGALIFMVGPLDIQLAYLILAIAIDLVFGIQVALKNKSFKWSILIKKVSHKLLIYTLWIGMFHAFDMVAGLPDTARWAVITMLAGLEIVSAIKNTATLGHSRLADALENLYLSLTKNNPTQQQAQGELKPTEPENVMLVEAIEASADKKESKASTTGTQGGLTDARQEAEDKSK